MTVALALRSMLKIATFLENHLVAFEAKNTYKDRCVTRRETWSSFSLVENEVNAQGREPLIFIAKLHKF